MGVRLPSPRVSVLATLLAVGTLCAPALGTSATPAPWGQWSHVDPYTTAKVLSICPTQADCAGPAGQEELELMVNGSLPRGLKLHYGLRSHFGGTMSVSLPAAQVPALASVRGVAAVHLDDAVHGTGAVTGISFPSLATLWPKIDNAPLDALTTDRPYRRARPLAAALDELRVHAGTQFCPTVVAAVEGLWQDDPEVLGAGRLHAVGSVAIEPLAAGA